MSVTCTVIEGIWRQMWRRWDTTEKTGINFLFLCQGKWKANECVFAESISFWLSGYLNIKLPPSGSCLWVCVTLLTLLSEEKVRNTPTVNGVEKMWSMELLHQMLFCLFHLPLKTAQLITVETNHSSHYKVDVRESLTFASASTRKVFT